jgi:hypothetical protein
VHKNVLLKYKIPGAPVLSRDDNKFPPTSIMGIGVNEIEPGAGEIEH